MEQTYCTAMYVTEQPVAKSFFRINSEETFAASIIIHPNSSDRQIDTGREVSVEITDNEIYLPLWRFGELLDKANVFLQLIRDH